MREVNLREARRLLSSLVDSVAHGGSVVITRRGKRVARMVPVERKAAGALPDLTEFRQSIRVKGQGLSRGVVASRRQARY